MGFLSSLFKALFSNQNSNTKPRKGKAQSKQKSFPYDYSDVAKHSLEMIEGIDNDQRKKASSILKTLRQTDRGDIKSASKELTEVFSGCDWRWLEWDYLKPICETKKVESGHLMHCKPDTKERLLELFCWTVYERMNTVRTCKDANNLGIYRFKFQWLNDGDAKLHRITSKDESNPWKHKVLVPGFAGGMLYVEPVIPAPKSR